MATTSPASPASSGSSKIGMNPYEFSKQVAETKTDIEGFNDLLTQLGQQVFEEQSSKPQFVMGDKTATEILAGKQAELQKEQLIAEARTATDWDRLQVVLGQDLAAMAHEQRTLSDKIRVDSGVSLWDDPLQAIVNAFTLPWDQQALEGVTQKIDSTNKSMQSVNNHVQQSAQTAALVSRKMTAGIVADTADALLSHQRITAMQSKMKAVADESSRTQALLSFDKDQLNAYVQWKNMQDQDEARAQRRKEHELRYAALQKESQSEETANYYVNLALRNEGKQELDASKLTAMKGQAQQYYSGLMRQGMKYETEGADWNWGSTIPERIQWMQTVGARPKTPQADKVIQAQIDTFNAAPPAGVTDAKAWKSGADQRFIEDFVTKQQRIDRDEGSIFAAPAYSTFTQYVPAVSSNPIWRDYIQKIAEASPEIAVNPQVVLDATAQAIRDGKVRQPEARAFVKQLFQTAVELNNDTHKFERITGGLRQKAFGTRLKTGAFGGLSEQPYDLTRSADIDLAIARSVFASPLSSTFQFPARTR